MAVLTETPHLGASDMTTHTTVIDDFAARWTAIDLRKKYDSDTLYRFYTARPDVLAFKHAFLDSFCDDLCAAHGDWLGPKKAA